MTDPKKEPKDFYQKVFISICAAPFICLLLAFMATYEGFVLVKLWQWFVTETFGIRALTIPQAIGISAVAGLLSVTTACEVKTEYRDNAARWRYLLLRPIMALAFGAIVHMFIHR